MTDEKSAVCPNLSVNVTDSSRASCFSLSVRVAEFPPCAPTVGRKLPLSVATSKVNRMHLRLNLAIAFPEPHVTLSPVLSYKRCAAQQVRQLGTTPARRPPSMERTREEVEKFAALMKEDAGD